MKIVWYMYNCKSKVIQYSIQMDNIKYSVLQGFEIIVSSQKMNKLPEEWSLGQNLDQW